MPNFTHQSSFRKRDADFFIDGHIGRLPDYPALRNSLYKAISTRENGEWAEAIQCRDQGSHSFPTKGQSIAQRLFYALHDIGHRQEMPLDFAADY